MRLLKIFLFMFSLLVVQISRAQQCIVPPTAIDASIHASYEYDKKNQDYIYTYKVINGPTGKLDISMIQIEMPQDVQSLALPDKWKKEFEPIQGSYPNIIKFTTSFNDIKPNSKPYIFKIKSKLPPGLARYYTEGMPEDQLKAVVINNDDEAAPDCPGFYMDTETILDQMITGITIGPVAANQVEVKLKMKVKKDKPPSGWDDEMDDPEISSIDKGKVEVVMYGAKDLDMSLVDLKSIQFGPAKASPISSKVVTNGPHFNHWRKKPDDKNKMLWMEFNLVDLQIRCDLDKALFLKAKAGDKNILGAVAIKPVLCDPKIWKQMGIERKWQKPDAH